MSEHEQTRTRVLEAAGPLFAEKGYDATSVRDITKLAETSPASVSYHFNSKEDLYIETVRHAAESCVRSSPMPVWPVGVPAEVRLRDFIHAFLQRILRTDVAAWHRQLIMREMADPRPGACEAFVQDFVRPTFAILVGVLRDLTPSGLPEAQIHLLGSSIVGQCLHYHHGRHIISRLVGPETYAGYDIEHLTDHIHAFSLAALRGLYPESASTVAGLEVVIAHNGGGA